MNNDLKIQTLSRIYDLAFKRISVKQIELIEKRKLNSYSLKCLMIITFTPFYSKEKVLF